MSRRAFELDDRQWLAVANTRTLKGKIWPGVFAAAAESPRAAMRAAYNAGLRAGQQNEIRATAINPGCKRTARTVVHAAGRAIFGSHGFVAYRQVLEPGKGPRHSRLPEVRALCSVVLTEDLGWTWVHCARGLGRSHVTLYESVKRLRRREGFAFRVRQTRIELRGSGLWEKVRSRRKLLEASDDG